MMRKQQLSLILAVSTLLIVGEFLPSSPPAIAGSCVAATSCPPQPLQFIPGETVTVEVINRTSSLVAIEQIRGTNAFTLDPGKRISFLRGGSVTPNFSVVMWDVQGLSLRFKLSQPQKNLLRVEVYLGDGYDYNDRSIYLRNDGRLDVF
jgi:hypothetical protein